MFFANAGAILRFMAQEVVPVGVDTINYVGKKAKPGIQNIADAVASGIAEENPDGENVPVDIRLSKLKDLFIKD